MDKKFKIICLECGSENVDIWEDVDYDCNDMPYITGCYLECRDCGSNDL